MVCVVTAVHHWDAHDKLLQKCSQYEHNHMIKKFLLTFILINQADHIVQIMCIVIAIALMIAKMSASIPVSSQHVACSNPPDKQNEVD